MSLETFEKLSEEKKELIVSTGIKEFSQKSYKEVSTDSITKKCGISKGILFHYFGSKKNYYLYCLKKSLERLTARTEDVNDNDFYGIIFSSMNRKLALCTQYQDEMHLVNMASRDACAEVETEKVEVIRTYMAATQAQSAQVLQKAIETLPMDEGKKTRMTVLGLQIYVNAVMNQYLARYQQTPDQFFADSEKIKGELKEHLDVMLYGICK
ncbi:MAG: TetR/AcrR family transcriptional regulator [bacterium]|nr:TetR/AcrR family transcriptional regulator [bacterium]